MFRFKRLRLHNWDLWKDVEVPLDGNVVILSGPNGSGKTTTLDAIRQLLGATKLSRKRRVIHYVRRREQPTLVRALVTNTPDASGLRAFQHEQVFTDEATLCCALLQRSDGTLEKRFAILPGDATLVAVRETLLGTGNRFYPPEAWGLALEHAGVTKSLLQVLATEQGNIADISEYSPQQLFQRVTEMLGDHDTLKTYDDAHKQYLEADKRVLETKGQITDERYRIGQLEAKVRRLEAFEALQAKSKDLEERLPAARLQAMLVERADQESGLPGVRSQVQTATGKVAKLKAKLGELNKAAAGLETGLEHAVDAVKSAREAWGAHQREMGNVESELKRITALEALRPKPAIAEKRDVLESKVAAAREHRTRLDLQLKDLEGAIQRNEKDLGGARVGRPVYPDAVHSTLEALREEKIPAELAANTFEPPSTDAAASIEGALGDARYGLIVAESHIERVRHIAAQHAFPGPIVEPEQHGKRSGGPAPPEWLRRWTANLKTNGNGSIQDERGTWLPRPINRIMGKSGLAASIRLLEEEAGRLRKELESLNAQRVTAVDKAEKLEATWNDQQTWRRSLTEIATLPHLRRQEKELEGRMAKAKATLDAAAEAAQAANEALTEERLKQQAAQTDLDTTQASLTQLLSAIATTEERVHQLDEDIRALRVTVSEALQRAAEARQLDSVQTVTNDLTHTKDQFTRFGDVPPASVRPEYRLRETNLRNLDELLAKREETRQKVLDELKNARDDYLRVVNEAIRGYDQRVRTLAGLANMKADVKRPMLGGDDELLAAAGIEL